MTIEALLLSAVMAMAAGLIGCFAVMRRMALAAEYQVTRDFSNIEVYAYLRNVVSLSLAWSY